MLMDCYRSEFKFSKKKLKKNLEINNPNKQIFCSDFNNTFSMFDLSFSILNQYYGIIQDKTEYLLYRKKVK